MKRTLLAILFFASFIFLWQFLYSMKIWSPVLMPSPLSVVQYLIHAIGDGTLIKALGITVRRLFLGYAIGLALGLPLGLLSTRFKIFEDTIAFMALGLQTLPSICWVPLALLWFGQTETAMLFVVAMGSLWSILLAAESGVHSVPKIYIRAARTMGSSGLHTWVKVILPASFPYIVSGMKLGWAFAWRSLMAAEIYVTIITGFGLGHLLHYGRELNDMSQVLGIMLIITLIGLIADKLLFSPWENFIHHRWGTRQGA